MMHRTLIVKGATDTDDLGKLGLHLGQKYSEADKVILIDSSGRCNLVKCKELEQVDFLDIEDNFYDLSAILRNIRSAYELAHNDTAYMAHCFAGQWLFHWPIGDPPQWPIELMFPQNIKKLRKSAEYFIERDFGTSAIAILRADGTRIDLETKTVSSDGSKGQDL